MATHEHAPVEGRVITRWFWILSIVVFTALVVLTQRFVFGLASVTNLSDGYPWGIWIAIDLIIGTALGCGGFVMAFLVYILNRGEYHPLVRAGLMTSLFGYTLGAVAVMIDLGRYWQGYNIMLPWLFNPNSVLLETALCIFAYIVVLTIEFSPAALERFGWTDARRRLNRVLFVFTGLGVLLPMMHQSSMGTVVVLLGYKLSPLWQSQFLTLFFLLTAITMGFAIVVFESVVASVVFARPYETRILQKLANIMLWVMVAFIGLRALDLLRLGAWPLAFQSTTQALSLWAEMAIGIAAIIALARHEMRANPRWLFIAASAMLINGAWYRLNCYLIGYDPGNGWSYFPSVGELLVTLGIFALHFLLYLIFVKQLPVLHAVRQKAPPPAAASTANPATQS